MSVSARPPTPVPVVLRELTVARNTGITPGMRRVTLTGAQLAAFTSADGTRWPAFASPGFDDDIRLLFPYPGESEPVLPVIEAGRVSFAEGRRPIARAYTVRRYDPVVRELDVDIVLHGDGTASNWAKTAVPGDRMHIAGPGKTRGLPAGTGRLLIAGDDTAIPAVARLLEELPGDARGQVLIDVEHEWAHPGTARPRGGRHQLAPAEHGGVRAPRGAVGGRPRADPGGRPVVRLARR